MLWLGNEVISARRRQQQQHYLSRHSKPAGTCCFNHETTNNSIASACPAASSAAREIARIYCCFPHLIGLLDPSFSILVLPLRRRCPTASRSSPPLCPAATAAPPKRAISPLALSIFLDLSLSLSHYPLALIISVQPASFPVEQVIVGCGRATTHICS